MEEILRELEALNNTRVDDTGVSALNAELIAKRIDASHRSPSEQGAHSPLGIVK